MNHIELLTKLREIATGEARHVYNGMCPDEIEGPTVRDDECPACRVLLAADALLQVHSS
jgi:hypothetical protein